MTDYDDRLALAVDLVNSFEVFAGTEHLGSVTDLEAFAAAHGIEAGDATRQDLDRLHSVRQVLRLAMVVDEERPAVEALNGLLAESRPLPQMAQASEGTWTLRFANPAATLADRLVAEAAAAALHEISEHGLHRFSTCDSSTCQDVFVDRSRNHSRRYCTSNVCGNREAQRAFRTRRRGVTSDGRSAGGR